MPTAACAARLVKAVEAALERRRAAAAARGRAAAAARAAFEVAPSVVDRRAGVDAGPRSSRSMPATGRRCSRALAAAIHGCGHAIHSAHIATYGERAVDVFYLTSADGTKLSGEEIDALRARAARGRARAGAGASRLKRRPAVRRGLPMAA